MNNTYKRFGIMADCSRNGVMNVSTVKLLIDCLVKAGYNALELYTEDTYEVEGEPYFGNRRGKYSVRELQAIDAYARNRGVELIPCIQTLAHFTALVKQPHYAEIIDVNDILLIDDDKTYDLIDKIFSTLSHTFTSRNVNIGMDEAHFVGLGKYLDKNGYHTPFELLSKHLEKVNEIAKKYDFHCHMWSDMYFRPINHGLYYGENLHVPEQVRQSVPEDIILTYWDYYHNKKEIYDDMLRAHKEFSREIWFAGGGWTWNGFAPLSEHALITMRPAMESIRDNGIENVLIALWSDNGKECSFFSVLPVLFAIRQYADGVFDNELIKKRFWETFGLNYNDFLLLSLPNYTSYNHTDGLTVENPCKSLLYADCFSGIFDDIVESLPPVAYSEYEEKLRVAAQHANDFAYLFTTAAALCDGMQLKYSLGVRTRKAYLSHDIAALKTLVKDYEKTENNLKTFYFSFRALWYRENKPYGFEIQEARLGGLMLRLSSCRERLTLYSDGKINCIDELEETPLHYASDERIYCNEYDKIISASIL